MKNIKFIIGLLLISVIGFAQDFNDTIKVLIDLKQVDSLGLIINVYPSSDLEGSISYQFPKTIPGIYEYLNNHQSLIKLKQNENEINCVDNSFSIDCRLAQSSLTYSVLSSVSIFNGVSAEDTYYLKDSIYVLNWHYLLGFFQNETERPYKIIIIKSAKLFGTGSLSKCVLNDSIDIYTANNYKDLIHNPILYSIPDTTNFQIGESKFHISCVGKDSLLNAEKIKNLLIAPLTEILKHSEYKHKEYTFIYYSEYSITNPGLRALEHPNSTLICYHSAMLDNNILISSSIHEFIHAIYAPLRIRSEIINDFNFMMPECDEYLWFYEGVTEYLAIKTLLNSGFFTNEDFLNEINFSNKYRRNINFSKISSNIYSKKCQKLTDNFYTTGSLFALQLDIEIIRNSNGNKNLFDVMRELQKKYTPDNPFNSASFKEEISKLSGIENSFIKRNVESKIKIDFSKILNDIGYSVVTKKNDTLIYSYSPKKIYNIVNFKTNRLEVAFFGSIINKEQNAKKITFFEINGKPITWFNRDSLTSPSLDEELEFLINKGESDIIIKSKPKLITKEKRKTIWIKNDNYETDLTKKFWNEE